MNINTSYINPFEKFSQSIQMNKNVGILLAVSAIAGACFLCYQIFKQPNSLAAKFFKQIKTSFQNFFAPKKPALPTPPRPSTTIDPAPTQAPNATKSESTLKAPPRHTKLASIPEEISIPAKPDALVEVSSTSKKTYANIEHPEESPATSLFTAEHSKVICKNNLSTPLIVSDISLKVKVLGSKDLFSSIASFTSFPDLIHNMSVSKSWHQNSQKNAIWKKFANHYQIKVQVGPKIFKQIQPHFKFDIGTYNPFKHTFTASVNLQHEDLLKHLLPKIPQSYLATYAGMGHIKFDYNFNNEIGVLMTGSSYQDEPVLKKQELLEKNCVGIHVKFLETDKGPHLMYS